MSAALEPEQDTILAVQLMAVRKTSSDEEFGKLLSRLLGTCRHEGFRIAMQALKIILDESKPEFMATYEHKEIKLVIPLAPQSVTGKSGDQQLQNKDPIPHVTPLRTREDALAVHRKNNPEMYNEDGTRKVFEGLANERRFSHTVSPHEDLDALERATRPDAPLPIGRIPGVPRGRGHQLITDEGREHIQKRAQQARLDNLGRHPKGWIKQVAKEYDVHESTIYNIIYSDHAYNAVPKP